MLALGSIACTKRFSFKLLSTAFFLTTPFFGFYNSIPSWFSSYFSDLSLHTSSTWPSLLLFFYLFYSKYWSSSRPRSSPLIDLFHNPHPHPRQSHPYPSILHTTPIYGSSPYISLELQSLIHHSPINLVSLKWVKGIFKSEVRITPQPDKPGPLPGFSILVKGTPPSRWGSQKPRGYQ